MKTVLVPLANGSEELEAVTVLNILRRAGIEAVSASLDGHPIRGSRGTVLIPDTSLDEALKRRFDMVVLPGGQPGTNNLKADARIIKLVQRMAAEDCFVCAVCAAPSVLATAGLLDGKHATSFPGSLDAFPKVLRQPQGRGRRRQAHHLARPRHCNGFRADAGGAPGGKSQTRRGRSRAGAVTSLLGKLPPSVLALLLQSAAFVLAVLGLRLFGLHLAPFVFALLCGTLAAAFSRIAGLARWWLFIQFIFAPALVLMLALNIPPGFFLAAFLVMLVVYWSTFRTQVPLYLSSDKVWQALAGRLPAEQPFTLVDLGSGIGGVLTYLARDPPAGPLSRHRKRAAAFSVELAAYQIRRFPQLHGALGKFLER